MFGVPVYQVAILCAAAGQIGCEQYQFPGSGAGDHESLGRVVSRRPAAFNDKHLVLGVEAVVSIGSIGWSLDCPGFRMPRQPVKHQRLPKYWTGALPDKQSEMKSCVSSRSQFALRTTSAAVSLAPGTQNHNYPPKQRESADGQVGIYLGMLLEHDSVSGGANDKSKIQQYKCVSQNILPHMRVLLGIQNDSHGVNPEKSLNTRREPKYLLMRVHSIRTGMSL